MEEVLIQNEPVKQKNWIMLVLIFGVIIVLIIFAIFIFLNFSKQPSTIKSCGQTTFSKDPSGDIMPVYNPQEPMICIGNNIINGCEPAKAEIIADTKDLLYYEIIGKTNGSCTIKITYADVDKLVSDSKEQFANKFLECPIEKFGTDLSKVVTDKDKGDLAVSYFIVSMFETVFDKGICSGSLKDSINALKNNNPQDNLSSTNCNKEEAAVNAVKLLNALKAEDFNKYQEACGYSILCEDKDNFDQLKDRFSSINQFTIKETKDWGTSVSVYFNEKVNVTSSTGQKFGQYIGIHYNKEGCKLKQFDGGVV